MQKLTQTHIQHSLTHMHSCMYKLCIVYTCITWCTNAHTAHTYMCMCLHTHHYYKEHFVTMGHCFLSRKSRNTNGMAHFKKSSISMDLALRSAIPHFSRMPETCAFISNSFGISYSVQ